MSDDDSDSPVESIFSMRAKFTPRKTPDALKAAAELVQKIEEENNRLKGENKVVLPKEEDQNVPKLEEILPTPVAKKGRKKKVVEKSSDAKHSTIRKDQETRNDYYMDDIEKTPLPASVKRRRKKRRQDLEMDLAFLDAQNFRILESKFDDPFDEPEELNVPENKVMNLTIMCLSKVARFKCQKDENFSKVFDDVAKFFNLVPKEFLLCLRDRNIALTDTPKSLSLTELDILECIPYKPPSEPVLYEGDNFTVTFQSNDMKTKMEMVINKMEKMQRIMERYSKKRNLSLNELSFEFDGEKLSGNETPEELDMEPGNCIDVRVFTPVAQCSYANYGDMAVAGCSYASNDTPVASCSYASNDTPVASCSYRSDDMPAASSSYVPNPNYGIFADDNYLQNYILDSDSNDSDIQILN